MLCGISRRQKAACIPLPRGRPAFCFPVEKMHRGTEKTMNFLRKFASTICLFGVSATLAPQVSAQQAPPAQPAQETAPAQPAQQAAPAQPASTTAATPAPADNTTSKPSPDATFRGVKVADAKGKQTDAQLIFSDSGSKLLVRVADRDFMSVPYDKLDKFSYEYTKSIV
jgi:hypothetical protein